MVPEARTTTLEATAMATLEATAMATLEATTMIPEARSRLWKPPNDYFPKRRRKLDAYSRSHHNDTGGDCNDTGSHATTTTPEATKANGTGS
jgi:hypothetical protein